MPSYCFKRAVAREGGGFIDMQRETDDVFDSTSAIHSKQSPLNSAVDGGRHNPSRWSDFSYNGTELTQSLQCRAYSHAAWEYGVWYDPLERPTMTPSLGETESAYIQASTEALRLCRVPPPRSRSIIVFCRSYVAVYHTSTHNHVAGYLCFCAFLGLQIQRIGL